MTDDTYYQEFANIFRCTSDMAPVYVARIRERVGDAVPMPAIIAAMKKIAPRRLSMDTIVARLTKTARPAASASAASRAGPSPAEADDDEPAGVRRSKPVAGSKPGAITQIATILTANWERGRRHGLKPVVMTADRFVRTAQSIAGTPKPSVTRVLQAIQKLDRRDILLTPNLVADEINETDEV